MIVTTGDMIFFFIFFWLLFIAARFFIFAVRIDIRTKKALWPVAIIGLSLSMLLMAYFMQLPKNVFFVAVPVTLLIIYMNLKGFYFCERCERMLAHKNILKPVKKCDKCGAYIKKKAAA